MKRHAIEVSGREFQEVVGVTAARLTMVSCKCSLENIGAKLYTFEIFTQVVTGLLSLVTAKQLRFD